MLLRCGKYHHEIGVIVKMNHEKFFDMMEATAKDLAPVASSRMAACIVIKNRIVGVGVNSFKSDPFQAKYGNNPECIFIHAEIAAIKNALKNIDVVKLSKATLYICRMKYIHANKREMVWGLAKPCKGCMSCIVEFGLKEVIYSLEGTGNFETISV
jgi:tRNA(Arg) A34 adenosine deaminase TadA